MKQFINKKRIVKALWPLFILNLILVADYAWSGPPKYEWGEQEKLYTAKKSQKIESDGYELFTYEGEEANCWYYKKEWQIKKCLKEHPYGGQGTLIMGGNLVVNDAQALYANGYDTSGYHWFMSTTTEPYGNAMALHYGTSTDILYGNHLLADGTMASGDLKFNAASSSVGFASRIRRRPDGSVIAELDYMEFKNKLDPDSTAVNALKIYYQKRCGECGDSCSGGYAGKNYTFLSTSGLEVKENLKVNGQIRLCGYVKKCEDACCRLAQYLKDTVWKNFVGWDCQITPCSGMEADPTCTNPPCPYCYPQPYPHHERLEPPDIGDYFREENGYFFRR